MDYLKPDTQEWEYAWAQLAAHPLNNVLPDSKMAVNNGEVWEYMGTDKGKHTFRHRCHPSSDEREYVHIPISETLSCK